MLFTQAHYLGGVYAARESGILDGGEEVRGDFLLVNDAGVPDHDGRHPAVFIEAGGHGIYGVPDRRSRVSVEADGTTRFDRAGWILRPASGEEAVREPDGVSGAVVPYALESTTAKLWGLLEQGLLVGQGRLLDGPRPYADARVSLEVPRFYEADRFSGPLGPDRGISPFAVGFSFAAGELGALFFDPAGTYADRLTITEPWSLEYVDYPY